MTTHASSLDEKNPPPSFDARHMAHKMHLHLFMRHRTHALTRPACHSVRLAVLWLACWMTAPAQEATPERPVDSLSQSALQNAFQLLRGEYIRGAELGYDELNRAAFQGLLDRLETGAELVPRTEALPVLAEQKVQFEVISQDILCMRICQWDEGTAGEMQRALKQHETLKHLILDLRYAVTPGDFETAAAVLELFVPSGELLFKLKQPGRNEARLFIASHPPIWTQRVVLLVDEDTGNLGETVAAVLRARSQALLLGARTRGATVRYESVPLDAAWLLRFARAEMLLADDSSLFRQGLTPDFPVEMPLQVKRTLFAQGREMKEAIFDAPEPRFNEAALLARKNPELDSYIRRSIGQEDPAEKPRLHDTVLQRAVDMLLMHDRLQGSPVKWPTPKPKSTPPTDKKNPPAKMP